MGICCSCRRTKAAKYKGSYISYTSNPKYVIKFVLLMCVFWLTSDNFLFTSSVSPLHGRSEDISIGQVIGPSLVRLSGRDSPQLEIPSIMDAISNIKMTNPIKGLVSKHRKRYMADGFNLDLTCILFIKII